MQALLDSNGVLQGFSNDTFTNGVLVPEDCDLEIGKYVYDGQTFHPILQNFIKTGPAPQFCEAVICALIAIRDGTVMPDHVLAWLKSEEMTLRQCGRL